jgi:hypothetical protein
MHDLDLLNLTQHLNQRQRPHHTLLRRPPPAVPNHKRLIRWQHEELLGTASRVAASDDAGAGAGADDGVRGEKGGGSVAAVGGGEVVGDVGGRFVVALAHGDCVEGSGWWEVYTETWTNGSISSNSPSLNGYSGTSIGGKMSKSKQLHTRQISSLENWHLTHLINEESGLCELGYRAAPICRGDFGFQSSDPATRPNFSPSICCGRCNRTDIRQTRGELPPADLSTGNTALAFGTTRPLPGLSRHRAMQVSQIDGAYSPLRGP